MPDLNQENGIAINNHPLLSKIHYSKEKLNLLRSLELLIIDEASMVASYTVDAIDTILRYIRRAPHQHFGGVQVLFIGDLYQLPPVVKREDWEILQDFYSSIFFFDSFVLRENTPVIIELKEIFRQKDDKFIEILNGIRNNNISEENFILLNNRIRRNFMPRENEGYITLTTHNYQSDEINIRKLDVLSTRSQSFHAEIIGEFPEHAYPAEKELRLKVGAQVMFLKNDTEGKQYFNGKIGVITKLDIDYIRVKCNDDFEEIAVKKSEWQNIKYKLNPDTLEIDEEILGSFIQYPLRLAWAITIHKSQGLTFDKMIIDAERAFAIGQVYVALSRCTSLEGLILKTPIRNNFLGAHNDFIEWQKKNWNNNLVQIFSEARQEFILEELQKIFTWKSWHYELKGLNEFITENQNKINAETILWIQELIEKQNQLYEVSEKFKQMIIRLNKGNDLIEENEKFQNRIKDGANYFYNEISKWRDSFFNHPLSLATKKLSRKADSFLEAIIFIVDDILQKINYCKDGFRLDDYLNKRKSFIRATQQIKSSYSKIKNAASGKELSTVEETVYYLHQGKTIQQIANERNLVESTIKIHLAKAISQNLIQIEEVMPIDDAKKIAKYFPRKFR